METQEARRRIEEALSDGWTLIKCEPGDVSSGKDTTVPGYQLEASKYSKVVCDTLHCHAGITCNAMEKGRIQLRIIVTMLFDESFCWAVCSRIATMLGKDKHQVYEETRD